MIKAKSERMPLYRKVTGQLREQCLAAGGEMLPSLRQLSQDLEVNHATVSRALRELESEGLVEIVPRKGIFSIRRPSQSANIEFVVLVNDRANLLDVAARMARGIASECQKWSLCERATGRATKMTRSLLAADALPTVESWLEAARARGTVGVIFLGFGYLEGQAAERETDFIAGVARKMPTVLAGSPHQTLALDCVYGDPDAQLREFLAHCYAQGARQFEYLGDMGDNSLQRKRRQAFAEFLQEHELSWQWDGLRSHQGAQLESELRALPDLPQVVVATNLYRAFTITLEAQRRGLQLPGDLDVLSFASVPEDAQPLLAYNSVVLLDEPEVGARSIQLLRQRIEGSQGAHVHIEAVPAAFCSGPMSRATTRATTSV